MNQELAISSFILIVIKWIACNSIFIFVIFVIKEYMLEPSHLPVTPDRTEDFVFLLFLPCITEFQAH